MWWNNLFVQSESVLFSLVNKELICQLLGRVFGAEECWEEARRSQKRCHEIQSDQDGKYADEVNKPRGSLWMSINGLI